MPRRESPETVWNPPDRAPHERRNARVKVIGSLTLLALVLVAVLVALLA